jgi:hypothetical protein
MPILEIPDIWVPSHENVEALPLALRRYIKALRDADRENLAVSIYWMQETLDAYKREIARLSALLRDAGIDPTPPTWGNG